MSWATLSREKIVLLVAIIFPLLILYNATFKPWPVHPERALFLGFVLVFSILATPLKCKGAVRGKICSIIDLILIMASIACAMHIILDWEYIVIYFGVPRPVDIILGIIATLVTLEACRRTLFPLVPLCLAFLLYAVFGHYLAGLMAAPTLSITRIVQQLYLQTSGLYGVVFNVGLKYVIPFLTMGCLLKAMGAMDVLSDFANILVGRTVGGPAKISVITSSMFGLTSGSGVANVVFTGTFTIPLMKRYGYESHFAGAVEACSSTGGQLMPPVMGVAAFIMADYTGIPYLRIVSAGILPALLYYVAIFLRVHYKAKQEGLVKPSADIFGKVSSLREIAPRLIPLGIIFAVLIGGLFMWTPTKAAVVATAAIIPLSFLRRETRLTPMKILSGLRDVSDSFRPIGAATIAMGILVAVAAQTGLGLKFSDLMLIASGESLALLLLVTAVACLIMGMGISGVVVYIFGGIMLAPALVEAGIPILVAHFFIFYWAQLQAITPPVCMTSYAAASIARAKPVRTAITACSVGIMGFVGAFLVVWHPELLLVGSPMLALTTFLLMSIGLFALVFAFGGYINRQLSLWERILFAILALAVFAGDFTVSLLAAVIIVILVFVSRILKKRSQTSRKED